MNDRHLIEVSNRCLFTMASFPDTSLADHSNINPWLELVCNAANTILSRR